MMITHKINNITHSISEWGIKEDIGGRKLVEYTIFLNNKKIGEFTYDKEEIPERIITKNFIQKHILENPYELTKIMEYLDTKISYREFFTEICEDDFYSHTKHDLRDPTIIQHPETRDWGRELNGTYFFFLKKNWDIIKKYYEMEE